MFGNNLTPRQLSFVQTIIWLFDCLSWSNKNMPLSPQVSSLIERFDRNTDIRDRIYSCIDIIRDSTLTPKDRRGLTFWLSDALQCIRYGNTRLAGQIFGNAMERMRQLSPLCAITRNGELNDHLPGTDS
jgi:hypothetical protein